MIFRKFFGFMGIPLRNVSGFMGGTVEYLNGTTPQLGNSSNPPPPASGTYNNLLTLQRDNFVPVKTWIGTL